MKLVRFGPAGRERPGILLEDGARLDCSGVGLDWGEEFFASEGLPRLDRIIYCTVWDRGQLSQAMREHGSDPEATRESLRALGFTHVLVNPTMLSIWERDQWNDPLLTRRSVLGFLEVAGEPLFDYSRPSEITIYALPP